MSFNLLFAFSLEDMNRYFLFFSQNSANANKSAKYIPTTTLDKAFNAKANAFVHNNLLFVQYITTLWKSGMRLQ